MMTYTTAAAAIHITATGHVTTYRAMAYHGISQPGELGYLRWTDEGRHPGHDGIRHRRCQVRVLDRQIDHSRHRDREVLTVEPISEAGGKLLQAYITQEHAQG